jgi:4-amino-4-deoxy-L-arabinose transferase-like glycosyltransferase
MSVVTLPTPAPLAQAPSEPDPARTRSALDRYFACLFDLTVRPEPWDRNAIVGLVSLVLLWAARFYTTWATWGYLPVDTGREMYVPAMLAQGKMLYRDIWYGYAPLGPYVNALLFRVFGIHLNVLYWAGSLAALSCAVLLFLAGKKLGSLLAGWTAGAIILMEAFHA